ncbi:hypothetical protein PG990_006640 [Apiospora arundinis]
MKASPLAAVNVTDTIATAAAVIILLPAQRKAKVSRLVPESTAIDEAGLTAEARFRRLQIWSLLASGRDMTVVFRLRIPRITTPAAAESVPPKSKPYTTRRKKNDELERPLLDGTLKNKPSTTAVRKSDGLGIKSHHSGPPKSKQPTTNARRNVVPGKLARGIVTPRATILTLRLRRANDINLIARGDTASPRGLTGHLPGRKSPLMLLRPPPPKRRSFFSRAESIMTPAVVSRSTEPPPLSRSSKEKEASRTEHHLKRSSTARESSAPSPKTDGNGVSRSRSHRHREEPSSGSPPRRSHHHRRRSSPPPPVEEAAAPPPPPPAETSKPERRERHERHERSERPERPERHLQREKRQRERDEKKQAPPSKSGIRGVFKKIFK